MKPGENMENERLVRVLARKFARAGVSEDDLYQEGCLALMKAEQTFRESSGVKFETYASRCISNRIIDVLRKNKESTDSFEVDLAESDYSLDDEVNLQEINKILIEQCSDIERAVFNSYFHGYSYEEISKIFEMPRKKIDNVIQKVRKVIKGELI